MMFDDLTDDIIADDWLVPQEELTERRMIRQTAHYTIYKADWFGDVLVYEPRRDQTQDKQALCDNSKSFATTPDESNWVELNELRLVAHENFVLFMGASIVEDQFAGHQSTSLVMEMLKPNSTSLFNLLHAAKSRPSSPLNRFFASNCRQPFLSVADKLNICQQVTNAMTYLHDKDIVHGRLTSVNVFIESNQRVKISLIDNDEQPIASSCDVGGQRAEQVATFNLPTLTYLSPELVRTIKVERASERDSDRAPVAKSTTATAATADSGSKVKRLTQRGHQISGDSRVQIDSGLLTKQADIYSFGTLLFELFEERFPFALDDNFNTTQTSNQSPVSRRSPSPTSLSTTKLFDTLCLAYHSPGRSPSMARGFSPRSPSRFSPPISATSSAVSSLQGHPTTPLCSTMDKHWNGDIKLSASELIFQIGSGQISAGNKHRNRCTALVDQTISACWSAEPHARPDFKQMRL